MGRDALRGLLDVGAVAAAGGRFSQENVVNLDADSRSILSLYKALIELRKKLPQLVSGAYVPIAAQGDLVALPAAERRQTVVIALNLGRAGFDRVGRDRPWRRNSAFDVPGQRGRKNTGLAGFARQ